MFTFMAKPEEVVETETVPSVKIEPTKLKLTRTKVRTFNLGKRLYGLPKYSKALPAPPEIDFNKVIHEIRVKTDIRHLSERLGLQGRALEGLLRFGAGRLRFFSVNEYIQVLMIHREFYPEGTDAFSAESLIQYLTRKGKS